MDIVPLNSQKRRVTRSRSERRHTVEVRIDQVVANEEDDESKWLQHEAADCLSQDMLTSENDLLYPLNSTLSSSWNNVQDVQEFESSQPNFLHEMNNDTRRSVLPYKLSYEMALEDGMVLSPVHASTHRHVRKPKSYFGHVIQEIVSTEAAYVHDLSDIMEGYKVPMLTKVGVILLSEQDIEKLFGNIEEIRDFNWSLLDDLVYCGQNPELVGKCFLDKADGFKIYTQYCNNYPNSVGTLTKLSKDPAISQLLKNCLRRLNHVLPLGAYLLKPVQRVLKYSLLLKDIKKHMRSTDTGFTEIKLAYEKMEAVAEHINDMKKKYDVAVHVQEVQSVLRGWEGEDLTRHGELVLEDNFRYIPGKSSGSSRFKGVTERYIFLFQMVFLVTKKEEDGYQYKAHLSTNDMQLTERFEKDANSFQIRQMSTGKYYTFQAFSSATKSKWMMAIKKLLIEGIPQLPDKAKLLILAGFPEDCTKNDYRKRHRVPSDHTSTKSKQTADKVKARKRTATLPSTRVASPTQSLVNASLAGLFSVSSASPPLNLHNGDSNPSKANGEYRDSGFSEVITDSARRQSYPSSSNDMNNTKTFEQEPTPKPQQSEAASPRGPTAEPETEVLGHHQEKHNTSDQESRHTQHDETVPLPMPKNCHDDLEINTVPTTPTTPLDETTVIIPLPEPLDVSNNYEKDDMDQIILPAPPQFALPEEDTRPPQTTEEPSSHATATATATSTRGSETNATLRVTHSSTSEISAAPSPDATRRATSNGEIGVATSPVTTYRAANKVQISVVGSYDTTYRPTTSSEIDTKASPDTTSYRYKSKSEIDTAASPNRATNRKGTVAESPDTTNKAISRKSSESGMLVSHDTTTPSRVTSSEIGVVPSPDTHDTCTSHRESSASMQTNKTVYRRSAVDEAVEKPTRIRTELHSDYPLPTNGNPDEQLSFAEALQSMDHYAVATGTTARSGRIRSVSPPPPTKKERRKRENRWKTISSISSDTIEAISRTSRAGTEPEKLKTRNTKVSQLARAYSKRIKEKRIGRTLSVVEDEGNESDHGEPLWLNELKQRRKSAHSPIGEDSQEGAYLHPVKGEDSQEGAYLHPVKGEDSQEGAYLHPVKGEDSQRGTYLYQPSAVKGPKSEESQKDVYHKPSAKASKDFMYKSLTLGSLRTSDSSNSPKLQRFASEENLQNNDKDSERTYRKGFKGWVRALVEKFSHQQ